MDNLENEFVIRAPQKHKLSSDLKIAVFVGAISLLLTLTTWSLTNIEAIRSDSPGYVTPAQNLLKYGRYSATLNGSLSTAFRLPGYPVLLLPFVADWPRRMMWVSFFQACMFGLITGMSFIMAKRLGMGTIGGILTAALICLDLTFIIFSKCILTDVPAAFFFYLSCFFLVMFHDNAWAILFLAGFSYAISVFHRPSHQALIFIPIAILLLKDSPKLLTWSNARFIRISKKGILFLLPLFLLSGFWIYRNYKVFGYPTFSTIRAFAKIVTLDAIYAQTKPGYTSDSAHQLGEKILDSFLKENPQYRGEKYKEYDMSNPLFESKDFIDYQLNFFRSETKNLWLWRLSAVPKLYFSGLFKRGNRHFIPEKVFGRDIGWLWTVLHSMVVCMGLLLFFIFRRHPLLIVLFIASSLYSLAVAWVFSPWNGALRYTLPVSVFIYMCAGQGLSALCSEKLKVLVQLTPTLK